MNRGAGSAQRSIFNQQHEAGPTQARSCRSGKVRRVGVKNGRPEEAKWLVRGCLAIREGGSSMTSTMGLCNKGT